MGQDYNLRAGSQPAHEDQPELGHQPDSGKVAASLQTGGIYGRYKIDVWPGFRFQLRNGATLPYQVRVGLATIEIVRIERAAWRNAIT